MAKVTIVFGIILIGLGLVAYFGSTPKSLPQGEVTDALREATKNLLQSIA